MTPDYIMRMLNKEDGLTARQINERLGFDKLTAGALNRRLLRMTRRQELDRSLKNGAYVYYINERIK